MPFVDIFIRIAPCVCANSMTVPRRICCCTFTESTRAATEHRRALRRGSLHTTMQSLRQAHSSPPSFCRLSSRRIVLPFHFRTDAWCCRASKEVICAPGANSTNGLRHSAGGQCSNGREFLPGKAVLENRRVVGADSQVRATPGRSLKPDASMKTMLRPSRRAFFEHRPAVPLPPHTDADRNGWTPAGQAVTGFRSLRAGLDRWCEHGGRNTPARFVAATP